MAPWLMALVYSLFPEFTGKSDFSEFFTLKTPLIVAISLLYLSTDPKDIEQKNLTQAAEAQNDNKQ